MLITSTNQNPGILAPSFMRINGEAEPARAKIPTADGTTKALPADLNFPAKDLVVATGFVSTGGKTEIWKNKEQEAVIIFKPDGSVLSAYEKNKKSRTRRYTEVSAEDFEKKYGFHKGMNSVLLSKLVNKVMLPVGSPGAEIVKTTRDEFFKDLKCAYNIEGISTHSHTPKNAPEVVKISFDIKNEEHAQAILDTLKVSSKLFKFSTPVDEVTVKALAAYEEDIAKYADAQGYSDELAERIVNDAKAISDLYKSGDFNVPLEDFKSWIDLNATTFELLGEHTYPYQEPMRNDLLKRVEKNSELNALAEGAQISTEFGGFLFAQSKIHGPMVIANHVLPVENQFNIIEGADMVIANLGKKLASILIQERSDNPSVDTNIFTNLSKKAQDSVKSITEAINDKITSANLGSNVTENDLIKFPSGKNLIVKYAALERRAELDFDSLLKDERRNDKRIKLPRDAKGFNFSLISNMENHKINNLPVLLARRDSAYALVGDNGENRQLRRKVTYTPMIILGKNSAASITPRPSVYEAISTAARMLEKVTPESGTYTYEKTTKNEAGEEIVETITKEIDVDKFIDTIVGAFSESEELLLGKKNIEDLIKPLAEAKMKDGVEKFAAVHEIISNREGKPYAAILDSALAPGSQNFISTLSQAKFVKFHADEASSMVKDIREGLQSDDSIKELIKTATFPDISFKDDVTNEMKKLTRRGAVSFQYLMIQMRAMSKSILKGLFKQGASDPKAVSTFEAKKQARVITDDHKFAFFMNRASDINLTRSVEGVLFATTHLKAPEKWGELQVKGAVSRYSHKVPKVINGNQREVIAPKTVDEIGELMNKGGEEYQKIVDGTKEIINQFREFQLKNTSGGGAAERNEKVATSMQSGYDQLVQQMGGGVPASETPVDATSETTLETVVDTGTETSAPAATAPTEEEVDFATLSAEAAGEEVDSADESNDAALELFAQFDTGEDEDISMDDLFAVDADASADSMIGIEEEPVNTAATPK